MKSFCISGKRSKTDETILSTPLLVSDWAEDLLLTVIVAMWALELETAFFSGAFLIENLAFIEDFFEFCSFFDFLQKGLP